MTWRSKEPGHQQLWYWLCPPGKYQIQHQRGGGGGGGGGFKQNFWRSAKCIWVRSRNCGCLVTWFCYQLIAKPGNKTATVSWPDPYNTDNGWSYYWNICNYTCILNVLVLQNTFWNRPKCQGHICPSFSCIKIIVFWLKFHWNLFPTVLLIICQHWFR